MYRYRSKSKPARGQVSPFFPFTKVAHSLSFHFTSLGHQPSFSPFGFREAHFLTIMFRSERGSESGRLPKAPLDAHAGRTSSGLHGGVGHRAAGAARRHGASIPSEVDPRRVSFGDAHGKTGCVFFLGGEQGRGVGVSYLFYKEAKKKRTGEEVVD